MKVKIGSDTYLMHWETRTFTLEKGPKVDKSLVGKELQSTVCRITRDSGSFLTEVASGGVRQYSGDSANAVVARRLSFLKAVKKLDRPVRKALGHEYNRTCRVFPATPNQRNRKLMKRIKELQKQVSELESEVAEKATV